MKIYTNKVFIFGEGDLVRGEIEIKDGNIMFWGIHSIDYKARTTIEAFGESSITRLLALVSVLNSMKEIIETWGGNNENRNKESI